MDQRRAFGLLDPFAEIGGEILEPAHDRGRQTPGVERLLAHVDQPSVAKEVPPAVDLAVGLDEPADQGVGGETEFWRRDGVKFRQ